MHCRYCGTQLKDKQNCCFECARDQDDLTSTEAINLAKALIYRFLSKLSSGEHGLVKTYWIYGVGVNVIASAVSYLFASPKLMWLLLLVSLLPYQIALSLGLWRSATSFKGLEVWAWLAKAAAVIGIAVYAIWLLVAVAALKRF